MLPNSVGGDTKRRVSLKLHHACGRSGNNQHADVLRFLFILLAQDVRHGAGNLFRNLVDIPEMKANCRQCPHADIKQQ